MYQDKKIVIINNEKISKNENGFYCDNIDMKSIPEGLSKNREVLLIARKSKVKRSYQINLKNILALSNAFTFLLEVFKTFKYKGTNYLLISITPYTFFSYILLFFFGKKVFIYLRSNGYEEYKAIFGFFGTILYHFAYIFVTFKSRIITCQKRLVKKKSDFVFPSELDVSWIKNISKPNLDKPKLLYVGRLKVEKGIFSLFKIFEEMDKDFELSIVGKNENSKLNEKKFNFLGFGFSSSELIKIYDNHNISILPSFTEAHPKVLDESLARARPVIIFEEISHVVQNRKGVFISRRDSQSLTETIKFIMGNYLSIQDSMSKNILPMKKDFISQITNILD